MPSTTEPMKPPPPSRTGPDRPPLVEWIERSIFSPAGRVDLIGAAACLGLMAWLFASNLRHFAYIWSTDENYSHGFLVPLISIYFVNEAMKGGPIERTRGVGLGLTLIVLSVLGRLATVLVPVGFVADGALLLGIAGICSLLAGTTALRRFGFAIGFLVFMIPLPVALYALIASPLQLMVSRVASRLLNTIGIPVLCQGNFLTLPGDIRLFVAEACSGMRQLTGFLALTTAVAYGASRPVWQRTAIVVASVPIALTANIVRVSLTGWISYKIDPRYASGAFHTVEGLLMMGFGLSMLYGGCRLLDVISDVLEPRGPSKPSDPPPAAKTADATLGDFRFEMEPAG
ncbi:exosortase/archaeosortase family protein [Isosphaeraceae bacterium EP7]